MITFTNLGHHGRLGNQFFQYAMVKAVSLELNLPLQLPDLSGRVWHGQECLLPQFQLSYEPLVSSFSYTYTERTPNQFDDGVFSVKDGTNFMGFFQHPSYFHKYREVFLKEFSAQPPIQKQAEDLISTYNNPTSIHIRRGDYVTLKQGHSDYDNLVMNYINTAMDSLEKDTDFLVFTGGSRGGNSDRVSDFDWCKQNIKGSNIHYLEGNSEILDFELIKRCNNNITGWDSTFSWWASYLKETEGKVFCDTKHQVLPLYHHTPEELAWVRL